jgi:inner membrane protein
MWSTLFIIDPAYTLPLLIGVLVAAIFPRRKAAPIALAAGIMISTSYIGWSWIAKSIIEHHAIAALKTMGLQGAPRFSIPTPFNTLLWRVVVMTDSGYMEGYRSLVADGGPMTFTAYGSDKASLESASDLPAVARLRWFTHDFMRTQVRQDKLILSDLRMGVEPTYIFSFAVATRGNPHWHAIKPERYRISIQSRNLMQFWDRIWHQPR